jgi:CheY-like chemotaxis protein
VKGKKDKTKRPVLLSQCGGGKAADAVTRVAEEAKEDTVAGELLLIVDDNPANMKVASLLLTAEGYDVRTATSAEEVLLLLETIHPLLILLDLQLPGMDGLELTRRLKADPSRRNICILAVTAYAMRGDEENARAAGCDGYITKPIDTRTLPSVVSRYLDRAPAP